MPDPYLQNRQIKTQKFALREADWRNGAITYQVIVDRFAEADNLDAKRPLYASPRRLKAWSELPTRGEFLPEHNVWSHEVDFWGGDLASLGSKLDYLTGLGVDVLYLCPIHAAFTNHKYDASDYLQVSPEYGMKADLLDLIHAVHQVDMKIVLDGVFNHVGRSNALFAQAASSPENPYRSWFYFNDQFSRGVRLWANAPSLPELNYENPEVCDYIYGGPDSVIRSYLRLGIDGWRLDTAFELGYHYLWELTQNAHAEKPGSLVVGEIWNYPADWFPALDSVMNFTLRQIILDSLTGKISPALAGGMIEKMITDAGIEPILKSWIVLDNHDTARLSHVLPDPRDQKLAQVLQLTLPGAPNLYYGSELGMTGGTDPANRAPMRWDLVSEDNEVYRWIKSLLKLRKEQRALKIGDYRQVLSGKLLAFERCTEKVDETVVVVVNPGEHEVAENILVPDSRLMNYTRMVDLLEPEKTCLIYSGILEVSLPAKSCLILKPHTAPNDGYTPYKRID